ncbi:hypothetical protein Fmac_031565 [Flemingia macrophylla]|uniref:Transposase (putative) gypsy type domain-containing protein n=1 Tax=Flemingia macrophylla TaxID=520843 RepID=A0ABD1L2E9_9FABA
MTGISIHSAGRLTEGGVKASVGSVGWPHRGWCKMFLGSARWPNREHSDDVPRLDKVVKPRPTRGCGDEVPRLGKIAKPRTEGVAVEGCCGPRVWRSCTSARQGSRALPSRGLSSSRGLSRLRVWPPRVTVGRGCGVAVPRLSRVAEPCRAEDQIGSDGGDGLRPKRGTIINRAQSYSKSLRVLKPRVPESIPNDSDSSEAETSGSNNVRSLSPNAVRSPEDVEGLAEVLERSVEGERHSANTEAKPKAEAGVSGRVEAEDGSDADVAAEHKRLVRKREFEPKFLDGFPSKERYPIGLSRCRWDESPHPDFVFLDKSNFAVPSFYVYDCLFRDLHVKLPFDDFILSVLWVLNVVPTQLHPNSWAAMQAFKFLCLGLGVTPTAPLFLYFYSCKPGYDLEEGYSSRQGDNEAKARWISLSRIPKRYILESFTSSYKNFNNGFFRVGIRKEAEKYFYDQVGRPLFLLAWTKKPQRCDGYNVTDLSEADREWLRVLSLAPRPIPPRMLILLPKSSQIAIDFIGIMTKVGGSEFDVKKLMAGRARPKSIAKANQGSDPSKLPRPTPQDIIPPATERKRKDKGTKKAAGRVGKCSVEDEGHATTSAHPEKKMKQTLIRDHGILRRVAFLRRWRDRDSLIRKCAALSQVLALEPSPELSALQAKLGESERVTREILTRINELVEDNKKLFTDNAALRRWVEELTAANNKLAEGREKATMELGKLDKEFKDYKTWAQAEAACHHEHGFNHAIRQAKRFCDLRGHEFDIGMDFCKGEYMSYDDMPEDADPDEDAHSTANSTTSSSAEGSSNVGSNTPEGETPAKTLRRLRRLTEGGVKASVGSAWWPNRWWCKMFLSSAGWPNRGHSDDVPQLDKLAEPRVW